MTDLQLKNFIETYSIADTFIRTFNTLLDKNIPEDLDIPDKNISIDIQNLTSASQHEETVFLKSPINRYTNEIGYYGLVFTLNGEIIDEYFVIY